MNRALLFLVALVAISAAVLTRGEAEAVPALDCSMFESQSQAQKQWELQGRLPAGADGDKDGRVCESLPGAKPPKAKNCKRTKRVVIVRLSARKYPHVTDHLLDVIRAKKAPKVLHIDRAGAEANREQSIGNWERTKGHRYGPAQRRKMDRDEFAPALSREGGKYRGRYADVRLVPSSENRSAGSSMGLQLRRWCDGQRFRIKVY